MFGMLTKLTKAAVAVAVAPVAAVVDTVMIIPDACDSRPHAYSRTTKLLEEAGKNVSSAIENDD